MSGPRLIVGIIVMGIAVPATIFFLLSLHTRSRKIWSGGAISESAVSRRASIL